MVALDTPAAQDHTHDESHRHRPLAPTWGTANPYTWTIRTTVTRPIGIIKEIFGFTKMRYTGLAKSAFYSVFSSAVSSAIAACASASVSYRCLVR